MDGGFYYCILFMKMGLFSMNWYISSLHPWASSSLDKSRQPSMKASRPRSFLCFAGGTFPWSWKGVLLSQLNLHFRSLSPRFINLEISNMLAVQECFPLIKPHRSPNVGESTSLSTSPPGQLSQVFSQSFSDSNLEPRMLWHIQNSVVPKEKQENK